MPCNTPLRPICRGTVRQKPPETGTFSGGVVRFCVKSDIVLCRDVFVRKRQERTGPGRRARTSPSIRRTIRNRTCRRSQSFGTRSSPVESRAAPNGDTPARLFQLQDSSVYGVPGYVETRSHQTPSPNTTRPGHPPTPHAVGAATISPRSSTESIPGGRHRTHSHPHSQTRQSPCSHLHGRGSRTHQSPPVRSIAVFPA